MDNVVFLNNTSAGDSGTDDAFDFSNCPWSIKDVFVVFIYSIAVFLVFSFWLAVSYSILRFIIPQRFVFFSSVHLKALRYFYIIFIFYASLFLSLKVKIFKKYHIDVLRYFVKSGQVAGDIYYGLKAYFKFLIVILTGIVMVSLVVAMWDMIFVSDVQQKISFFLNTAQVEKQVVISRSVGFPGAVILLILAPIFEELYFRGCLYRALRARFSSHINMAIITSSFVFSLLHGYFPLFVYVFLIGIVLAYLYEKRRSLVAPLTFHMVNNLVVILFFI